MRPAPVLRGASDYQEWPDDNTRQTGRKGVDAGSRQRYGVCKIFLICGVAKPELSSRLEMRAPSRTTQHRRVAGHIRRAYASCIQRSCCCIVYRRSRVECLCGAVQGRLAAVELFENRQDHPAHCRIGRPFVAETVTQLALVSLIARLSTMAWAVRTVSAVAPSASSDLRRRTTASMARVSSAAAVNSSMTVAARLLASSDCPRSTIASMSRS